jgi:hypothetical protein
MTEEQVSLIDQILNRGAEPGDAATVGAATLVAVSLPTCLACA